MVRVEERSVGGTDGWDIRGIYEGECRDKLESLGFFMAFGKVHVLDGHKVECIFTKAKHQKSAGSYGLEGVESVSNVLIVRSEDMAAVKVGASIRVDGELFSVSNVSRPSEGLVRLELESSGA